MKSAMLMIVLFVISLSCIAQQDTATSQPITANSLNISIKADSKQCSAMTVSGHQCTRMTTNASGKCWQHEKITASPEKQKQTSIQCLGITQERMRCRNMTSNKNGLCHAHQWQAPYLDAPDTPEK